MTKLISLFIDIFPILNVSFSIVGLLAFVAMGFGLFRMTRSCQLTHPWTGWIPFANIYLTGKIADHYCYRNEEKNTTYRRRLLVWSIVSCVVSVLMSAAIVAVGFLLPILAAALAGFSYPSTTVMLKVVLSNPSTLLIILGCAFVMLAVLAVYAVFFFMALHKVYKLFAPKQATLFLVLSILVPLATQILFLVLSGRAPAYTERHEEKTVSVSDLYSM